MAARRFGWFLALIVVSGPTLAQAKCFATVGDLAANNVRARWVETTANDGKPLSIAIANGAGGLVYSATKAGQLWLTGNVSVCRTGEATRITLKDTRATDDVPAVARLTMPSTQTASIVDNRIRLGGAGWGGTFVGH